MSKEQRSIDLEIKYLKEQIESLKEYVDLFQGKLTARQQELWELEREAKWKPIPVMQNSGLAHLSKKCVCEIDHTCPLWQECANHVSAGDFRTEGGMTPALRIHNGVFECTMENTNANHGFNQLEVTNVRS